MDNFDIQDTFNEDNISEYKNIDLEIRKSDYCKILSILKYLER